MKKRENSFTSPKKNRKWLFLVIGIGIGFLAGISVFLLDKYMFKEKLYVYRVFDNLYKPKIVQDTIIQEKTVFISAEQSEKDTIPISITEVFPDSLMQWDDDFAEWDNVDFFMEMSEPEDVVVSDKIIKSRKIQVKIKNSNTEYYTEGQLPYSSFEVQQWSTPIRNSITYQNYGGTIKIKGMDITNIEIFFMDGSYYLYNGNHYFMLSDNQYFERLVAVDISRELHP